MCPSVDDVVILHDEKLKRSNWRLGRVNKLIISDDKNIHSAEIVIITKRRRKIIRRPVNKLYPVELQEKDEVMFIDETNIPLVVKSGGSVA